MPSTEPRFSDFLQRSAERIKCDFCEVTEAGGKTWLFACWNRQSSNWERNGEPVDFTYVERKVIASGRDIDSLTASTEEYIRRLGMTILEFLAESAAPAASRAADQGNSSGGE